MGGDGSSRVLEVFRVFDELASKSNRFVIAFSGGKDSTALAILLLEWILDRGRNDLNVTIIHSDTLSEIPEMESWARAFAKRYSEMLRKVGVEVETVFEEPQPTETFYWRVFVRGYPAPTFNFRWCVKLLKRKPAQRALKAVDGSILLLGHRDSESSARAQKIHSRLGCPLGPSRCSSYYFSEASAVKAYPIRGWSDSDVFNFLRERSSVYGLDELLRLYGYGLVNARYGCWHCTLVRHQLGHLVMGGGHMYFEALRKIYRWVSDIPELRIPKERGYSRLGALNAGARSLIHRLIPEAEKLSGINLYGLDMSSVYGHTLREIFYTIPPREANEIVMEEEKKEGGDLSRIVSIEDIRNIDKHRSSLEKHIEKIIEKSDKDSIAGKYVRELLHRVL